jgi:23S rRNA (uracil1939-C5)-methyltransferase
MPHELGKEEIPRDFALGLHVPGTFDKVLDIDACLLQPEAGNALLGDARRLIRDSGLPAYGIRKHTGFWRYLMLRHSVAADRWMVNIVTAEQDDDLLRPMAQRILQQHPRVQAVVNNITSRKAGIAVGEREVPLAGQPVICDKIGNYEFEISANSFFQTNTAGARQLLEVTQRFAGLQGDERLLDLYCGTGTITIGLSERVREAVGIEIVASAVDDARRNCRRNSVSNCRFIHGDILQVLPGLPQQPDVVVIDPPRAGMHKKVVGRVLELLPPRIIYVSCNPATLARDLEMMKERYRVAEVQPVDMFPHTFHIESVARLERAA